MPQKHYYYSRSIFDGIGEGGGEGGVVKAITRTASAVKNNNNILRAPKNVFDQKQEKYLKILKCCYLSHFKSYSDCFVLKMIIY